MNINIDMISNFYCNIDSPLESFNKHRMRLLHFFLRPSTVSLRSRIKTEIYMRSGRKARRFFLLSRRNERRKSKKKQQHRGTFFPAHNYARNKCFSPRGNYHFHWCCCLFWIKTKPFSVLAYSAKGIIPMMMMERMEKLFFAKTKHSNLCCFLLGGMEAYVRLIEKQYQVSDSLHKWYGNVFFFLLPHSHM